MPDRIVKNDSQSLRAPSCLALPRSVADGVPELLFASRIAGRGPANCDSLFKVLLLSPVPAATEKREFPTIGFAVLATFKNQRAIVIANKKSPSTRLEEAYRLNLPRETTIRWGDLL